MKDHWEDLLALLAPIHDRARATARRLCRGAADGDDLFQETLLRALGRLGSLRDRERFRPWFYAVLLSVHRSRARRAFWRRFLSADELGPEAQPVGADGSTWEDERHGAARMARALATLPAVMREAIVLHDIDEHPVEDVAEMQGVSLSAVKSRLSRGRERLKRWYEGVGGLSQVRSLTEAP